MVLKPGSKRQVMLRRDPVPEVLFGDAPLLRRVINAVPFKRRYSAMTLSFHRADIDVRRFNAGDPAARAAVDLACRLVLEVAFAGLPVTMRPPVYCTTHTHTGRLEVNIAFGGMTFTPKGMCSFNPDPPRSGSRKLWAAVQNVLNQRFGWADPGNPRRRQRIKLPDYVLKREAEERRTKSGAAPDWRRDYVTQLEQELGDIDPQSRAEVLIAMEGMASRTGVEVLSHRSDSITVCDQEKPSKRVRLRGFLMRADFVPKPDIGTQHAKRQEVLSRAPAQLRAALEARRKDARKRYGLPEVHGADVLRPVEALLDPQTPARSLIPTAHPDYPHSPDDGDHHDHAHHPPRAPAPGPGSDPRPRDAGAGRAAEGRDRSLAAAAGRLAVLCRDLDRSARRGLSALDRRRRDRLGRGFDGLRRRLSCIWMARSVPAGLHVRLDTIRLSLEQTNDRFDRSYPVAGFAGKHPAQRYTLPADPAGGRDHGFRFEHREGSGTFGSDGDAAADRGADGTGGADSRGLRGRLRRGGTEPGYLVAAGGTEPEAGAGFAAPDRDDGADDAGASPPAPRTRGALIARVLAVVRADPGLGVLQWRLAEDGAAILLEDPHQDLALRVDGEAVSCLRSSDRDEGKGLVAALQAGLGYEVEEDWLEAPSPFD
ncbi:hypothetical protein [Pseudoroseicyclus aestuarii]|uniref:hypothetical protein n=1 Tax=Pseudoroseicyclus aestuarii TaxID=1795041 RepID=UPI0011B66CDF|nr:hypothetical protein [Pseudoroseicyclus aestuarii]